MGSLAGCGQLTQPEMLNEGTEGSRGLAESAWEGGAAHRLPTDFGVLPRPPPSALPSGSTLSDPILSFCLGAAL